jgi:5'-methylthioadenosine phosphorylase
MTRSNGKVGVPPHAVNYRANIFGLKEIGVRCIFATSVVGSLTTSIEASTFVVLDQFLDFTKQRSITLFGDEGFAFVDVTDPYCPCLRDHYIKTMQHLGVRMRPQGCYVGVEGPRYETRAEIEMYRRLGGDVIGMTNLPEVVLAREAGLCYASIAFVSNLGAGLNANQISREDNYAATTASVATTKTILRTALSTFSQVTLECNCNYAAEDFLRASQHSHEDQ